MHTQSLMQEKNKKCFRPAQVAPLLCITI